MHQPSGSAANALLSMPKLGFPPKHTRTAVFMTFLNWALTFKQGKKMSKLRLALN